MSRKKLVLVGDFETTVYDGQTSTEVWASGLCELYTENAIIFNCIEDTYEYLCKLKKDCIVYYHNLAFDGVFWLIYLLNSLQYKQAYGVEETEDGMKHYSWLKPDDMPDHSLKYSISMMGKYYYIIFRVGKHIIELRDSYKLLPYSVENMGKSFRTKHRKLTMEYKGFRQAHGLITPEEESYLKNDLYVVKEALEHMFDRGHTSLTIGSCCMSAFRKTYDKKIYDEFFPDLTEFEIDNTLYGSDNAYQYIHKSYRGGWCYVRKDMAGKKVGKGLTCDVNSLYPSRMHSSSGCRYPIGLPRFWKGDVPQWLNDDRLFYFIRIRTRFYLKEGKLPFLQIKGNPLYKSNDYPETTDVWLDEKQEYVKWYIDYTGKIQPTTVIMTLAKPDYELFFEHYNVTDFEVLDGCAFETEIGIFDEYLEQFKHQKEISKGAEREEAKLFMNNLYGKMATNTDSSFKVVYVDEENTLHYEPCYEYEKKVGYIPCGSAITSYARTFTVKAAQANYYGKGKNGFIYADTDSIHCNIDISELKGVRIHPTDFNAWKCESYWDSAIFVRQKTYIEHVTHENQKPIEKPYYDIKCAGMTKKCKDLLNASITQEIPEDLKENELKFVQKKRTLEDFKSGLVVPGKLTPKRISGGLLLVETDYKLH